jgi:hypothetical protein
MYKFVQITPISKARAAIFLICLGSAHGLIGQTQTPPPPVPPADAADGAKTVASAPQPKWTEDLTAGVQLDEGRAGTKGITVAGDIWEKYSGGVIRFDAGETYGSILYGGKRLTSVNKQGAQISWTHDFSKKYYFTQIDSIDRDEVLLIDYRATSLNAIGIRLQKEKLAFDFGPGIAPVDQQKHTPQIDGFKLDAGAFYSLVYSINPKWHFTHWATYRNNVTYSSDRIIDSATTLTGMITKAVGLKVSVAYNYDGVLSVGALKQGFATRNYLTTTVGVSIHH